jgi:nitroreductase
MKQIQSYRPEAFMPESIFFQRKSLRSYLPKPVEQDKLDRIFEKVRWSPSCNNNQPWKFIVVRDKSQHEKFMTALPRGNQWAAAAPILIAVCARPTDDVIRKDDHVEYYSLGCGLAVMSLLLASVEEGLMGHPMAGYDSPALKEQLGIPTEYNVLCIISLGYLGPIELLDEFTRKKDESLRTRKPLDQILAYDQFTFTEIPKS